MIDLLRMIRSFFHSEVLRHTHKKETNQAFIGHEKDTQPSRRAEMKHSPTANTLIRSTAINCHKNCIHITVRSPRSFNSGPRVTRKTQPASSTTPGRRLKKHRDSMIFFSKHNHSSAFDVKKKEKNLNNHQPAGSLSNLRHHLSQPISIGSHDTKKNFANPHDYNKKDNRNTEKNKKIKCRRWTIIIGVLGVLLLVIGITVLLVHLLAKPKEVSRVSSPTLRWNSTGITVAGVTGVNGSGSNQLNNPWGLFITYDYILYIVDRFNNRIQKFVKDASSGVTVAGLSNGTHGISNDTLNAPAVIVFDSDQNLYIADSYNHRVQFWRNLHNTGVTVAGTGTAGTTSNRLHFPYGIARDEKSGILYISDSSNHRVMRYQTGALVGDLVAGGNGAGLNTNQLNRPIALTFDQWSNSLIIVNFNSHNIVCWSLGNHTWTLIAGDDQGLSGNTSTLLNGPMGLTLDPMGNLYVADRRNHRIQLFMNGQSSAITIAGIANYLGNASNLLNEPYTMTLDNQLNLYVADTFNHRIQKFLRY